MHDHSIIICAEPEAWNAYKSQTALVKIDQDGNLEWTKIINPYEDSFPYGSILNDNGSLTIFGTDGTWERDGHLTLMKTGPNLETHCPQQERSLATADLILTLETGVSEELTSDFLDLDCIATDITIAESYLCGTSEIENNEKAYLLHC
ncbi:MAG: hypothetical protein ACI8ZM_005254 [Crocinitomix sp.]|jgi:hypothetical protein